MVIFPRRCILCMVMAMALPCLAAQDAPPPDIPQTDAQSSDTPPSDAPPSDALEADPPLKLSPQERAELEAAIADLSSADPAEREAASLRLWSAGRAAEPLLREAAKDDDPEQARRAREVLQKFEYGISPDTPAALIQLLEQYQRGQPPQRRNAINLLASKGPAGTRILLKIWRDESDPQLRSLVLDTLASRAREAAALLLAEGDEVMVERLLQTVASGAGAAAWRAQLLQGEASAGDAALRDYAAYLHDRGKLPAAIAALASNAGPGAAPVGAGPPPELEPGVEPESRPASEAHRRLAYYHRAAGDLPAARAAAEASGDERLVDNILIEQRDWAALADRVERRAPASDSLDDLSFAAGYRRLAGDREGAQKWLDKVVAYADPALNRQDEQVLNASEILYLNERPDLGMQVLIQNRQYETALRYLRARLMFAEAQKLIEQARQDRAPNLPLIEAREASLLHFLGKREEAIALLRRLAEQNTQTRNPAMYAALVRTAGEMRERKLAEELLLEGLPAVAPEDLASVSQMMSAAGIGDGDSAARWWAFLRKRHKEPLKITLERLRSLLKGQVPATELETIARAAEQDSARMRPEERVAWLLEVGEMLLARDRREAAQKLFERVGFGGAAEVVVRLGDLEAADNQWADAARLYGRAWEMDKTQPLPLLLRGRAFIQLRREQEGRDMIRLAHLLPLGDERRRQSLVEALEKRTLFDEMELERDLAARTGGFMTWALSDTLRRGGDLANTRGDFRLAAELWERAFLDNLSTEMHFIEPTANLMMPALLLRTRALAHFKASEITEGVELARACLAIAPGDTDALIDFVTLLDSQGKTAEADAIFAETAAVYAKLCEQYPQSGPLHNQYAWAAARCKRQLDTALAHATLAVKLEPDNTASLDTLAETHFQRGEVGKAIETINQCIKLEPEEKHHREQLNRFEAALPGGKVQ